MLTRWRTSAASMALTLAVAGGAAPAQETVVIGSAAECRGCTIEYRLIMKFGDADGPGTIGRPNAFAKDSRGRFYYVSEEESHIIKVFGPDGRYLRRIGRRGEGPDEFRNITRLVVTSGDTLHAFDSGNGRHAKISPEGDILGASRLTGWVVSATAIPAGIAIASNLATPERIGYPLHIVRGDSVIRSFGADPAVYRKDMFYAFQRLITGDHAGDVWAAHRLQYVVDAWTQSGVLKRRIVRDAPWMPPQWMQRNRTDAQKEHPEIQDVRFADRDHLWVAVRVNEDTWYRGLGEPFGTPEGRLFHLKEVDLIWGSRVELLNVATGSLVLSGESDEMFIGFTGPFEVLSYRENDRGVPRILAWELRARAGRRSVLPSFLRRAP